MSLADVARLRIFASVTGEYDLVRNYVSSHEFGFGGANRPEAQIINALCDDRPARHIHVYGDAGAGKTSLILRSFADIAKRETLPRPIHPLFVNTGDAPAELADPQRFMQMLLGLISVNKHQFANVDPIRLRDAAAQQTTYTPGTATHLAGITSPVFTYQLQLSEAFATKSIGAAPGQVRSDFADVLSLVSQDYRPVIVIDDTDHFAASGPDGDLNAEAITNLYQHGVYTLAEFDNLDVVVAIQPHFQDIATIATVEERFHFERVEVATFPADRDEPALSLVLRKRLGNAGITTDLGDLIDEQALAELQGVYFSARHDLRRILGFADKAAQAAVDDGATRIAPRHVQGVLER